MSKDRRIAELEDQVEAQKRHAHLGLAALVQAAVAAMAEHPASA